MIRNRVHLVPAGLEQWFSSEVHAYTKLGRQETVGLQRYAGKLSVVTLPDRVVSIASKSPKTKVLVNELGPFDFMTPFISPEVVSEPIVLINPYHAVKNYNSDFARFGKKVIVDSGGFQMLRGTAEFVHPDELLEFYNKFGDICMPLDLPLPATVEPYFFDSVTKMMRANDQYMEPRLEKGRILALISQGSTVPNRLRRIDGLKRKSKVTAIAGLNTLVEGDTTHKTMTALTNGMAVISHLRKDTDYFHFLGVTSNLWIILYSILVGTGYVKRCGGDSVSFRMASINGSYRYGLGSKMAKTDDIMRTQKTPIGTTCRCPVCRTITDHRILLDYRILESHMVWNAIETKNLIADSVEVYLKGGCSLRDISDQWMPPGRYDILARAVDYLNLVIQKGYKEWKPKTTNSLFAKVKKEPPGLDHYKTIIGRYEKFHKRKFL